MDQRAVRAVTGTLIGLAALYSLALRIYVAWGLPLWVDESWTAVLSAARSLPDWARQAWLDSNAPFYYFLIYLWPFESDFGLKLPSLLFLLGACATAALWRPGSLDRNRALFWAALVLLWRPGLSLFIDARYYGLLFFLCVGQTIAFARLLERPDRARACYWVGLSALAALTHYYAVILIAAQGLVLLWRVRFGALRLWPAALLGTPLFAEFAWHWPRLQLYAANAWYERIRADQLLDYLAWPITGSAASAIGVLGLVILFRRKAPAPIAATVIASAICLFVMIGLGMLRPTVVPRYLIPAAPGLLLGIAAYSRPVAWLPITAVMCLFLDRPATMRRALQSRAWYGLEVPAAMCRLRRARSAGRWSIRARACSITSKCAGSSPMPSLATGARSMRAGMRPRATPRSSLPRRR